MSLLDEPLGMHAYIIMKHTTGTVHDTNDTTICSRTYVHATYAMKHKTDTKGRSWSGITGQELIK